MYHKIKVFLRDRHHLGFCDGSIGQLKRLFSSVFCTYTFRRIHAQTKRWRELQRIFMPTFQMQHRAFKTDFVWTITMHQNVTDVVELLSLDGVKPAIFVTNVPCIPVGVEPNRRIGFTKAKATLCSVGFVTRFSVEVTHSNISLLVSEGTSLNTDRHQTQRCSEFRRYSMQPNWSSVTVKACLCLKDNWRLIGQQCDDNLPEETADSFLERSKGLSTLGDFLFTKSLLL